MKNINDIIEKTSEKTANKVLNKLKKENRIKYYDLNSFTRTEKLLYLYPKLNSNDPERLKINDAMKKIKDNDYSGVIESYYFYNMTFEKIAEIYGCCYQTISKQRVKLVKRLAIELFPEEVLKETLEN